MAKTSAGVLLFRRMSVAFEVLLVHPGGPFWARKDLGAWSIPKGEYQEGEDPEAAARRELREETGLSLTTPLHRLAEARQRSGKSVIAFTCEADFVCSDLVSNHFEIEWPPRSGITRRFPEVDRAQWFAPAEARVKMLAGQCVFLDALAQFLTDQGSIPAPSA